MRRSRSPRRWLELTAMAELTTEQALRDWRSGSTQAEQLAAEFLRLDGFDRLQLQSPLGGPDGGKDLIAFRGDARFIVAVFFPPTEQPAATTKAKFESDLAKALPHAPEGFAFFTNQRLTVLQKRECEEACAAHGIAHIVYDLHAIRALLDSAPGYALRGRYLGIEPAKAEIISFMAWIAEQSQRAPAPQTKPSTNEAATIGPPGGGAEGSLVPPPAQAAASPPPILGRGASLRLTETVDMLCLAHRLAMPHSLVAGKLRTSQVWIGSPGSSLEKAVYVPPPPNDVPALTHSMLTWWTGRQHELIESSTEERIAALAEFHHAFLSVHPFVDGNGRVARSLLSAQSADLLGPETRLHLSEGPDYLRALQIAHTGDMSPLTKIIEESLQ